MKKIALTVAVLALGLAACETKDEDTSNQVINVDEPDDKPVPCDTGGGDHCR